MADAIFEDPRLARVYDPLDPDRRDLDAYLAIVEQLGARTILDVGCGTGTLACLLAARGLDVVGVDPAAASLAVARSKPGADRVRWIHGEATALLPLLADVAVMTGNVAQVFTGDDEWMSTLHAVAGALRPGGTFVVETRVPARRAWERWTPDHTRRQVDVAGVGVVESWQELLEARQPLVTFRTVVRFHRTGEVVESRSTLRFRDRPEVEASLQRAGFHVDEVRDAPDRPGLEHVFVASRG